MKQPDDALARLLQSIEADRRGLFARLGDFDVGDFPDSGGNSELIKGEEG